MRAVEKIRKRGLDFLDVLLTYYELLKDHFPQIEENIKDLQNNFLKSSSNFYCFSNELSLADLFLIPQIYNGDRFGVNRKALPLLEKINTV